MYARHSGIQQGQDSFHGAYVPVHKVAKVIIWNECYEEKYRIVCNRWVLFSFVVKEMTFEPSFEEVM